ncbi:lysophospholipase-like protein 1 [Penaeus chinensis]|uniref:lysophospholipase-like protein 1 n=1 Tax=Penaeus chinensis TaxID=139456 RepID=UPI001FB83262|nr:lysophospholipase-like protein 1 [Penaeus chinensis]XP_047494357.1 lysophospholipase-like protein 1 [Penaeus chinensis]
MSHNITEVTVVPQTGLRHTATLIFMHGSGWNGVLSKNDLEMVFGQEFSFPHIRVVYPTSPERPYTPCSGMLQHVWFDRQAVDISAQEDVSSIKLMAEELNKLIDKEISLGIDVKRIVIGGFSMGSSMALQMGYCFRPDVAGIIALSSFLNQTSNVYKVLETEPEGERPPLFMCHGDSDKVVPFAWGERTFAQLQQRGVKGEFHSFPGLNHSLCKREVELMKKWLVDLLPDV